MHILYVKYIVICADLLLFVHTTMSEPVLLRESDDVMISADPFKIASLVI